ncbi:hypothetical protein ACG93R_19970 [Acinetobacter guillouiae]|uniref:hypothetical protein n=1 Tax=Acinetobacter guillouiae TaxID=106649 RepID=UPI003AF60E6B
MPGIIDQSKVQRDIADIGKTVNEDVIVSPRSGLDYDSLPRLVRLLSENGMFKPFESEAELLANVPEVAPTAAKALDTKKVWIWKQTSAEGVEPKVFKWIDTGLSELEQANKFATSEMRSIFGDNQITIVLNPIFGYGINTTTPESTKFTAPGATRAYLQIDVSTLSKITVSNATTLNAGWKWVFRDANDIFISMNAGVGNGDFLIPVNAKWAYRTYQIGDANAYENPNLSIVGTQKYSVQNAIDETITLNNPIVVGQANTFTDTALYGNETDLINLNPISGYAVDTTPSKPGYLTPQNNDIRKYVVFNVKDYAYLNVSNSSTDSGIASWYWVFKTDTGAKIVSSSHFNGKFEVPENAVEAYRTVYYKNTVVEYDDIAHGLTITASPKKPRIQPQIDKLASDVAELMGSSSGNLGAYIALQQLIQKMDEMLIQQDIISPNDFEDATQMGRLKSAINFVKSRGYGIVELGVDKQTNSNIWTVTEAITLPSNCWIYINKATVKRGNGVFDNIFRNDGIVPDQNPFNYATQLNENVNIRVFGNSKADSFIDGNLAGAKVAPHPVNGGNPVPWISDYYGWRAISILFANTKYHHVFNLSLINSQNWTISNEHGCSNFSYHDLYFNTTVKNGDGVNVRFGCYDFEIYNIDAKTSDDTVACNSLNNFLGQHPSGNYIYPTQVGGYSDRGFGVDVYNGEIYNIKASSSAGVGMYFSGGSKIYNINVSNVQEYDVATTNWLVHINARYGVGAKLGDCHNITINNVESNLTDKPVYLNAPLKDVWVNKVIQNKVTATPAVSTDTLYVEDNVQITNVQQAT